MLLIIGDLALEVEKAEFHAAEPWDNKEAAILLHDRQGAAKMLEGKDAEVAWELIKSRAAGVIETRREQG